MTPSEDINTTPTKLSLQLSLTPEMACRIILEQSNHQCENYTSGIGSCFISREIHAKYPQYQVCNSCLAGLALEE